MDQLLKFINNLNTAQRAVILGGFSLLLIFLIGLLIFSNIKAEDKKLSYTIATNLTKSQVMSASSELEASGVPFSVVGSGDNLTLKTSKDFVNIAKIKLVTSEGATSQHVGWEIFEKSSLGTTNFENKVKYLRALEGELSRSLESLSNVIKANVKIAIPKETIFVEKRVDPTASAVLNLRQGVYLTQKQINGIKNFIASAIPNLKEENIQLIDQDGTLLERTEEDVNSQKSYVQEKYKQKVENDFERKIIALLEPFVGNERVVAKVSVNMDFMSRNIEEEIFQPEGTVRSQQVIENVSASQGTSGEQNGVAGVEGNIEDNANNTNGTTSSSNEGTNTVTNYEISKKIIRQQDNNYSKINKISAAVTFDSTVLENVDNKEQFLQSITQVVQDTIGYDQTRGDTITVKDFKFINLTPVSQTNLDENGEPVVASESSTDTLGMVKTILQEFGTYIQYIIAGIILLVFYKKFIANHQVVIQGGTTTDPNNPNAKVDIGDVGYEDEYNIEDAKGRLKSKIKSQIMNNIEGLDEESAAKYEILIEELDKQVQNSPGEVAQMIELLLAEGNKNFK